MPKQVFYAFIVLALGWVWFYYMALIWRKKLLAYLQAKHPEAYRNVAASFPDKKRIDRVFADGEVVRRRYAQERCLLGRAVRVDAEAEILQRRYRTYVLLMVIGALVFLVGTTVVIWIGRSSLM